MMPRATPPAQRSKSHHGKYPCFIGFYVTQAQWDKLDTIVRQTHRGLGETMRMLVDHAECQVVELNVGTPAQITPKDAA
jgi:hypothetical protein